MFRRHWSGLPKDASFPADLKDLGYFVNDEDEIRCIESPDHYFKFFIDRNDRINQRQRFVFDQAMEDIIHQRLEGNVGLEKIRLPIGTPASKPHVPIFADSDIKAKKRVVMVFGETTKGLGLLAGRIANGPGGLDKGSLISVVRELRAHAAVASSMDGTPTDTSSSPGVVLANMGQLYWWPEGKRTVTIPAKSAIPMSSLVHSGVKYVPSLNDVPGNESPARHVQYLFEKALPAMLSEGALLDIIAIGDSCEVVQEFLDKEENWAGWGRRLSSMVLVETISREESFVNSSFKDFLAKRTRCYTLCPEPVNTPLAPPSGNETLTLPALGTPIYSSSESQHVECITIAALEGICSYLQQMALHPDAENEVITIMTSDGNEKIASSAEAPQATDWEAVPEDQRPSVQKIHPETWKVDSRNNKLYAKLEETGSATREDLLAVDAVRQAAEDEVVEGKGSWE